MYCGMCGNPQSGQMCSQKGCRQANHLPPFEIDTTVPEVLNKKWAVKHLVGYGHQIFVEGDTDRLVSFVGCFRGNNSEILARHIVNSHNNEVEKTILWLRRHGL